MSGGIETFTATLIKALDRLFHAIGLSVGVAVILTVAVISYGATAREVFGLSDIWVTDVTTYLMGYMTFVGMATLAWQGKHLRIDVVGHFLGPRGGRVLTMLALAVTSAISLCLLWLNVQFWWDAWDSNEHSWGMLSVPLWIPYLSLLIGSALLVLAQIGRLLLPVAGK